MAKPKTKTSVKKIKPTPKMTKPIKKSISQSSSSKSKPSHSHLLIAFFLFILFIVIIVVIVYLYNMYYTPDVPAPATNQTLQYNMQEPHTQKQNPAFFYYIHSQ